MDQFSMACAKKLYFSKLFSESRLLFWKRKTGIENNNKYDSAEKSQVFFRLTTELNPFLNS